MGQQGSSLRRRAALILLVGAALPSLWLGGRGLIQGLSWGWETVGTAGLAARLVLSLLTLIALVGMGLRREWGSWIGRGVGLYWVALAAAPAVMGRARLEELAMLAGGGLLLLISGPEAEPGQRLGDGVRRLMRGWCLALNVAALPVVLSAATPAVASSIGLSASTLAWISTGLALVMSVGLLLTALHLGSGMAAAALADLGAIALYAELIFGRSLGHHDTLLLPPAAVASVVAAALFVLMFRRARRGAA